MLIIRELKDYIETSMPALSLSITSGHGKTTCSNVGVRRRKTIGAFILFELRMSLVVEWLYSKGE
jgi:hypothetical protein